MTTSESIKDLRAHQGGKLAMNDERDERDKHEEHEEHEEHEVLFLGSRGGSRHHPPTSR